MEDQGPCHSTAGAGNAATTAAGFEKRGDPSGQKTGSCTCVHQDHLEASCSDSVEYIVWDTYSWGGQSCRDSMHPNMHLNQIKTRRRQPAAHCNRPRRPADPPLVATAKADGQTVAEQQPDVNLPEPGALIIRAV
eukprot:330938-Chlamydomonas_euryale.AAC.2